MATLVAFQSPKRKRGVCGGLAGAGFAETRRSRLGL